MAGGGDHSWRGGGESERPPKTIQNSGGPGGPTGFDPCDLRFETTLNAIDPATIENVARGNKLTLEIVVENSAEKLEAKLRGIRVGIIVHPKTLDIIRCIRLGNRYVASVVTREGNLCRVLVEREV